MAPLAGRGSYPHRWLQERIRSWLAESAAQVQIEYPWRGQHLDVFARWTDGTVTAYEVVLSLANLDQLAAKAKAFIGSFRIVVVDRKASSAVEDSLSADGAKVRAHVSVLTLRELISTTRQNTASPNTSN